MTPTDIQDAQNEDEAFDLVNKLNKSSSDHHTNGEDILLYVPIYNFIEIPDPDSTDEQLRVIKMKTAYAKLNSGISEDA